VRGNPHVANGQFLDQRDELSDLMQDGLFVRTMQAQIAPAELVIAAKELCRQSRRLVRD
jgi:hypothetical protein